MEKYYIVYTIADRYLIPRNNVLYYEPIYIEILIRRDFKMNIKELQERIMSFSLLKENWDSYNADKITKESIETALDFLDIISKTNDINDIAVFPTRCGGIQFEIGHYKDIEILNYNITEYEYDYDFNIVNKTKTIHTEHLKRIRKLKLQRIFYS